ncbi:methyltransferase domain-containing protein [Streptomonospora sp. S1-112]|uniref:Methyltransferase domain-containing protein n=1 Tax=Streptomonospora mangrovi TaxID=2883123 RepID=A0A9X3NTN9_9ACTN|nr:class I SAM-dependent methyltransferase [Streptomonospora mangrovi]MDA0567819.1 methyltransferase domain-containing protein [Streptomonospora mangrovi]
MTAPSAAGRPAASGPAPDTAPGPGYAFDNDSVHAAEQHGCLAAAYDTPTTAHLERTGVGPGWHCLEIGAGQGSVAAWLARRVAPSGRVVATDIKPGRIPAVPGLVVLRHDIVRDPLPERAYDLVHARLVLSHLPERRAVLARLLRTLRPGGRIQVDEFDSTHYAALLPADPDSRDLYARFHQAKLSALRASGGEPAWGRDAAADLCAAGFTEVEPVAHTEVWTADSPGARLQAHHTRHLRDRLVAAGMTDDELARVRHLMADPGFRAASCVFYTVQGRRSAD